MRRQITACRNPPTADSAAFFVGSIRRQGPQRPFDIQCGQFGMGSFQGGGGLPFELGDHAARDRDAEAVEGDLLDLPFAESINSGEIGKHGL
jgi:hypothetical protein